MLAAAHLRPRDGYVLPVGFYRLYGSDPVKSDPLYYEIGTPHGLG